MMRADHPLQIPLGWTLWLIWFGALYGGLSLGCALAPPTGMWNWLNATLAAGSFGIVALLLWLSWRSLAAARRHDAGTPRRFVAALASGGHLTAALATLITASPLLRLPPCA